MTLHPFARLHGRQRNWRFEIPLPPPRATGIMWSISNCSRDGHDLQRPSCDSSRAASSATVHRPPLAFTLERLLEFLTLQASFVFSGFLAALALTHAAILVAFAFFHRLRDAVDFARFAVRHLSPSALMRKGFLRYERLMVALRLGRLLLHQMLDLKLAQRTHAREAVLRSATWPRLQRAPVKYRLFPAAFAARREMISMCGSIANVGA